MARGGRIYGGQRYPTPEGPLEAAGQPRGLSNPEYLPLEIVSPFLCGVEVAIYPGVGRKCLSSGGRKTHGWIREPEHSILNWIGTLAAWFKSAPVRLHL
jgi:hypothetical protein